MKKKLVAILCVICSIAFTVFFASCGGDDPVYSLDQSAFNPAVTYGASIDYSDFVIVDDSGNKITVTEGMVSGWDTSSVGRKELVISYEDFEGKVGYVVKYEVKFVVDGNVVSTQYVLDASELQAPAGYAFEIPSSVSGNLSLTGSVESTDTTITIGDAANEIFVGSTAVQLRVSVTGASSWSVESSNDNISVVPMNGMILISANKVGVTELTVTAGGVEARKTIVIKPTSLTIEQGTKTYGIEDVYTIGRTNVDGAVDKKTLKVSCAMPGEGFEENVVWTSNKLNATIDNGEITLAQATGSEIVTFTANFFGVQASFDVRCVYDGVNVSTYEDLYKATKAQKAIVLESDIAFPTNVSDIKYETIHTTYDDTFYRNTNCLDLAKIKVLLQFKNNVYGNGYEINAHNATLGLLDATGHPIDGVTLFKGPLNFVALTPPTNNSGLVSVKGQDNVCFGVYENVTLNNVILKGANLENDLTELEYAGTTVEVFGNNVNIEYSRIMNGRTVLRAFGDATNPEKVINVNIKNSVLSGAREFIIRMGSNAFVDGKDDNISPYINNRQEDLIGIKSGAVEKSADYESNYIKTFVNLTNCVLKDAGVFAIGIDSHFAGKALHNGEDYIDHFNIKLDGFQYWKNLAKTSYGAKLTFNGEVKMLNWRALDDINSDTIIEINEEGLGEELTNMLKFDVPALLKVAKEKEPEKYGSIIVEVGGTEYVHNGIAFFGGGKNYGLFENNTSSGFEGFEVPLSVIDMSQLTTAAGTENFYFNIYDSSTAGFTPEDQLNMNEKEMYSCIYNK